MDYFTIGPCQGVLFSSIPFRWDDLVGTPVSNIVGGPGRLSRLGFAGTYGGAPEAAWFKVYEMSSPNPLVDGPDIAVPFSAGVSHPFDGNFPGITIREGDANGMMDGAYFDVISLFTSKNPGTDTTDNPVTSGTVPVEAVVNSP